MTQPKLLPDRFESGTPNVPVSPGWMPVYVFCWRVGFRASESMSKCWQPIWRMVYLQLTAWKCSIIRTRPSRQALYPSGMPRCPVRSWRKSWPIGIFACVRGCIAHRWRIARPGRWQAVPCGCRSGHSIRGGRCGSSPGSFVRFLRNCEKSVKSIHSWTAVW